MIKRKKTGCQTPEFSKPTPPPNPNLGWQPTKNLDAKPPNTGSNVVKPNPNYTPPPTVKKSCIYETPCGWCSKWDKKCDKRLYTTSQRLANEAALKLLKETGVGD